MRAVVESIGHAVPDKVLTNADLEKLVETSDEWIRQRTGIVERRIVSDGETASTLGARAALEALGRAGVDAADVDLVVCGTVTGDMLFPSTACLIQEAIGAKKAGAFDVGAACAGFIHALAVSSAMIESKQAERILVVGVDVLTRFVDWTDRGTCILFGDGGGALLIRGEENTDRGILKTVMMSDGSGACHINLEVGGSRFPSGSPDSAGRRHHIYMAGREVYRFAVNAMGDACYRALAEAGLKTSDVDLFVPHQANIRIIQSAAERLGLPEEKVLINVDRYGNTSGGSIPLGLYEAVETGRLQEGMIVMTVGFGAGLVWGANVIRW